LNDSQPLLSIILPTYERIEGLKCLLSKIDSNLVKSGVIELIVSDDSLTDLVEVFCRNNPCFIYIRHDNTGNPIDNWNSGIRLATGFYIQVLHHDEYPKDSSTYGEIIKHLSKKSCNILVPRCHFIKNCEEIVTSFAQSFFTQRIVIRFPYLLLGFNVIGSPSLFIYINKRDVFDRKLTYLVDVDFYFKQMNYSRKTGTGGVVLSSSVFLSDTTFDQSITKSLEKDLEVITVKEQEYILNKTDRKITEKLLIQLTFYLRNSFKKIKGIFS